MNLTFQMKVRTTHSLATCDCKICEEKRKEYHQKKFPKNTCSYDRSLFRQRCGNVNITFDIDENLAKHLVNRSQKHAIKKVFFYRFKKILKIRLSEF